MPTLTAITIDRLKPKAKRYEVRDARSSLRVLVLPSGTKSFVMRYRGGDGRSVKLTLGRVREDMIGEPVIGGPLSLAAARKLAASVELQRAHGHEPEKPQRQQRVASDLFPVWVQRYVDEYASVRTRGWKRTARMLGIDGDAIMPATLCDRWRGRPVNTITRDDIHNVVDEVRQHGVPGWRRLTTRTTDALARRMHAMLSSFFTFVMAQRGVDANPCDGVDKPPKGAARERVLNDVEIASFWRACDELDPPIRSVFRLLLLTGQRRNEVARMRWDELTDDIWTLPPARTKNKRGHAVPLGPQARSIIEAMPRHACAYVFTNDGARAVNNFDDPKRVVDALMNTSHWTLHDLRRTAATGMARAGADLHVIERVLNHTSGSFGGIVGVYQKYRYADEVRRALEAWESLVMGIVSGKVVSWQSA